MIQLIIVTSLKKAFLMTLTKIIILIIKLIIKILQLVMIPILI
jgi:hypothetical protein